MIQSHYKPAIERIVNDLTLSLIALRRICSEEQDFYCLMSEVQVNPDNSRLAFFSDIRHKLENCEENLKMALQVPEGYQFLRDEESHTPTDFIFEDGAWEMIGNRSFDIKYRTILREHKGWTGPKLSPLRLNQEESLCPNSNLPKGDKTQTTQSSNFGVFGKQTAGLLSAITQKFRRMLTRFLGNGISVLM